MEEGKITLSPELYEDIHMANEQLLTERIGDAGKRLHTARSRNDQVALDMRLYVRKEIGEIISLVLQFMEALCDQAADHLETVMPGYTHLQRAQPITFAHHLMAYANMFKRDVRRLEDCLEGMDEMPLGCGALAGTTYPIDREFVAKELGFSTGSSIMPQKKNPDVCELIRGKTGRVFGDLQTLLVMMKGLPLAYNKDMQEDKEAVFDAIDTVKICLKVFAPMFATMTVIPENMRAAAKKGFLNATDCADYLTKKGVPFRDAYKASGTLVAICIEKGETLDTLPLEVYRQVCPVFEEDVYRAVDLNACVRERKSLGGPAPEEVARQLEKIRGFLKEKEGKVFS